MFRRSYLVANMETHKFVFIFLLGFLCSTIAAPHKSLHHKHDEVVLLVHKQPAGGHGVLKADKHSVKKYIRVIREAVEPPEKKEGYKPEDNPNTSTPKTNPTTPKPEVTTPKAEVAYKPGVTPSPTEKEDPEKRKSSYYAKIPEEQPLPLPLPLPLPVPLPVPPKPELPKPEVIPIPFPPPKGKPGAYGHAHDEDDESGSLIAQSMHTGVKYGADAIDSAIDLAAGSLMYIMG